MNGTEQRARHTAVAAAERRIADLELVVVKLGEEILAERETFATHLLKQHDACQARWEGTTAAIADLRKCGDDRWLATGDAQKRIFDWQLAVDRRTLWQWLRRLVGV